MFINKRIIPSDPQLLLTPLKNKIKLIHVVYIESLSFPYNYCICISVVFNVYACLQSYNHTIDLLFLVTSPYSSYMHFELG